MLFGVGFMQLNMLTVGCQFYPLRPTATCFHQQQLLVSRLDTNMTNTAACETAAEYEAVTRSARPARLDHQLPHSRTQRQCGAHHALIPYFEAVAFMLLTLNAQP